ncbi:Integrase, catalytic core [Gossypium australe]|uniref:Integrase, catalytic core n=1 Tax=Gossypium australe TaxID=47621 RepID=A0A5B6W762_9ROSI|nr:Integrase, catalytic core [Gossypium australe]
MVLLNASIDIYLKLLRALRFQANLPIKFWGRHASHFTYSSHASSGMFYPLSQFLSYSKLASKHTSFLAAITNNDDPKTYSQTIKDFRWQEAMKKELVALDQNQAWTLEPLPSGKKSIGCKWWPKVIDKLKDWTALRHSLQSQNSPQSELCWLYLLPKHGNDTNLMSIMPSYMAISTRKYT